MVIFKRRAYNFYISDGRVVARRNGFMKPTTVILYFEGVDNRFSMFPAMYEGGSSVVRPPPSIPAKSSRSWSDHPTPYFKTVISPDEERIHICPYFLNNFESIIDFKWPVTIVYRNNQEGLANWKHSKGTWYLIAGYVVAKIFGFKKPTTVYLDFQFKNNLFIMSREKPKSIVNRVADKRPINVSSDSEDESDDEHSNESENDSDEDEDMDEVVDQDEAESDEAEDMDQVNDESAEEDIFEFNVKVTQSLAYKKQVLHFPTKTSKFALLDNQKQIYLRDVDTMSLTDCTIITSNRSENEKYLREGWYTFVRQKHLRPGDVLHCTVEDPPQYMNVKVICAVRRR
ncbi:hypothetical protein TSUD_140820 [Trifolium subterraneum]|uniref:TF-B3 domain-containing protein n=1 Tax=Trifolium subterraneum TaxID=3900 RepID=A0A2Z6NXE3_TRISU|nr:hypothetical protein TSUD_140820 [Trifolium subterraneum]